MFSFLLGRNLRGAVTLEVIDTPADEVIRRYDFVADGEATAGLHRVVWDLRYAPPTSFPEDQGPLVVPGTYQVRLTVNGRPLRQAVVVRMDPRLRLGSADLVAQLTLARRVATQMTATDRALAAAQPETRVTLTQSLRALRALASRVEFGERPALAGARGRRVDAIRHAISVTP